MTPINFTSDQRRMINLYISQYNQVNSQIDRLYNILDEIRSNINTIANPLPRHTHVRTNIRTNNRSNIFYDYQNPINPSIYTNTNTNTSLSSQMSTLLSSFLNSPVTVRPSAEQLDRASRLVRYGDLIRPISETCPISLDRFNIGDQVRQIHHCGHLFVPSQFDEWFQSNVRCPVCRFDVRNHNASANAATNASANSENAATNAATNASANATTNASANAATNASANAATTNASSIDSENADAIINTLTARLFESLLNPLSNLTNNDHFEFDASNNILIYETVINPDTNPNNMR